MKHLNLIGQLTGASLTAAMSLSVLVACDSRGVTAMKSRVYSPEEMATEKLRRQGLSHTSRTGDLPAPTNQTTPAPAPTPGSDKTDKSDKDPVVSDKEAGSAQYKLFEETKDGLQAKKSDILLLAKRELGKINKGAVELLKGLTIVDKSVPGKPRLAFDAILMPDDRALELHAEFDVDVTDQDVVNGNSNVKIDDLSAVADADIDPSRVAVATVCEESEKNVCKSVILVFSVAVGQGSKDALVEVKLGGQGEVPNAALVTNAGLLKSFVTAQTEFGAKMPEKTDKAEATKATIKPVATVARPTAPFAADAKDMKYKEFAAKYAEWKKTQANADQWPKHPRPTTRAAAAPAPQAAAASTQAAPVTSVKPTVAPATSAKPQMPTADEAKTLTRSQVQARITAYENTLPVMLPDEPKNALLKLAKADDKPAVAAKADDAKPVTEVKTIAQKKAEYEATPLYKKPFTKWFWWPEDKAAQLTAK